MPWSMRCIIVPACAISTCPPPRAACGRHFTASLFEHDLFPKTGSHFSGSSLACSGRAISLRLLPQIQKKLGDIGRHHRIEIRFLAHHTDVDKLRLHLAAKMRKNARAQALRSVGRSQHLDLRNARAGEHRYPAWLGFQLARTQAGLFLNFTHEAACEVNPNADYVAGLRRSSRKIDFACIGGVGSHDPEQKSTIACL